MLIVCQSLMTKFLRKLATAASRGEHEQQRRQDAELSKHGNTRMITRVGEALPDFAGVVERCSNVTLFMEL